jgi:hypothetical protein
MVWIDIGMTVLLTLRMVLFRLVHPQLLDLNNDVWLMEEKQNSRSASSLTMEKCANTLIENPYQEQRGLRNYIFM